ncbi:ATP-binding protein [uncultured Desulfobacter sp.]|uniref:GAF domain-containing sensor histidine kinase n=1 Tax=uncultured Desulfobacter sp. TaxID=240139 RepID=UPI002AAAD017|nr:ATP-binding protein [uncultured Desulfobacter sp.]
MEADSSNTHKELYNSLILDTYVRLIKDKYPDIEIQDLMDYAGIENYEIGDYSVWFTQKQVNYFHERLSTLTDNMKIAWEAGRYAANPKCMGEMRGMVFSAGGIRRAYEMIGKYARHLNRSSSYTTRVISSNKVELVVSPHDGVQEGAFQCQNRLGNLRGIADVFSHKDVAISHPECIFKGGRVCRYEVSWRDTASSVFAPLSWVSLFVTIIIFAVSQSLTDVSVPQGAGLVSLLVTFGLGWANQMAKARVLQQSLNGIYTTKEELLSQIEINAENSRVIIDIGQALGMEGTDTQLFERAARIAGSHMKYDLVMIMIANEEKTVLSYGGGYGFTEAEKQQVAQYSISLDDPSQGVFYEAFRHDETILVNDMEWLKNKSTTRSFQLADLVRPFSFIASPIDVNAEPIGLLIVGNNITPELLDRNDKHLIMGVAQQIGTLYRRQKYEKQQAELKNQIVQLQKMETLGVLAGGIAHDFNNILLPILGYTDLSLAICSDGEQIQEYLIRIKKAVVRAQELVGQILAFSRQGKKELIRCHPGPIVKEALKLLGASVPEIIKIESQIPETLAPIMADPTQIHQLVMNLCTNAYHAMSETGGVIRVRLDQVLIKARPLVDVRRMLAGNYLHLQVEDTGHGMTKEVMDNIFEPYFTTKKVGKGTGLGLSIVQKIVTHLKGYVFVDSRQGRGSCFDVYLPQQDEV